MRLITLFLSLTIIASCTQHNTQPVREAAEAFYKKYPAEFRKAGDSAYTSSLAALIQQVREKEISSAAAVKASAFPTDKPALLEGDLFSGLNEGFNQYALGEVMYGKDTSRVVVTLTQSFYKKQWNDTLVMVNENGWKVDNVLFGPDKPSVRTLREEIGRFLATP